MSKRQHVKNEITDIKIFLAEALRAFLARPQKGDTDKMRPRGTWEGAFRRMPLLGCFFLRARDKEVGDSFRLMQMDVVAGVYPRHLPVGQGSGAGG